MEIFQYNQRQQHEFRNFNEVLNETASNWNSYSGVQQRAIAQAFSGTTHMNEFMVLMQQWDNLFGYLIDGGTVFLNLLTNIVDVGSGLPALGSAITGILGANGKGKHKVIVINALFYKIA